MRRIVLLGAGASKGSGDASPTLPPLGRDLFGELEQRGGLAAQIPSHIKKIFRDDFEAGMALYFDYADGHVSNFQRELAEYLAIFTPGPKNVYHDLVKKMGVRRTVFCSLNYDLLLELSAKNLGIKTTYNLNPGACQMRLIKPHGSCNFWPDILGEFRSSESFGALYDEVGAGTVCLGQEETLRACENEDSISPVLSLYMKGKSVRTNPEFLAQQIAYWKKAVSMCRKVFVVGVRLVKEDTHIWEVLGKASAEIVYFGRDDARDNFIEWHTSLGKNNCTFIKADFSESVDIMISKLFE